MITLVTRDQRRDVSRLMSQAGITPRITEVRPGDEELTRITGARTPSGVPVVITVPVVERPRRTASAPSRSRSRRRGAPGRQGQAQSGAAKGGAQTAQDRAGGGRTRRTDEAAPRRKPRTKPSMDRAA